jgi:hypothetical protein
VTYDPSRHGRIPERNSFGVMGFWQGDIDIFGQYEDRFIPVCESHPAHTAVDCSACRLPTREEPTDGA